MEGGGGYPFCLGTLWDSRASSVFNQGNRAADKRKVEGWLSKIRAFTLRWAALLRAPGKILGEGLRLFFYEIKMV
jgi:hypothetical protein